MKAVLLANLVVTCVLVGLIWTIQVVHYPLFARVGADAFPRFHAEHTARITMLVAPLMLAEVVAALLLVTAAGPGQRVAALVAGACVAVAWLNTGLQAVPLHGRLGAGLDVGLVDALVRVNAVRTLAWTLRAVVLAWLFLSGSWGGEAPATPPARAAGVGSASGGTGAR